jgi:hypothetical protein
MDVTPTIISAPGEYLVKWQWPEALIEFEAGRLKSHTDGRVQATVKVFVTLDGQERAKLHHENMNLGAGQTRRRLVQTLGERLPRNFINWDRVIEISCMMILEQEEQGSPTRRLASLTQRPDTGAGGGPRTRTGSSCDGRDDRRRTYRPDAHTSGPRAVEAAMSSA